MINKELYEMIAKRTREIMSFIVMDVLEKAHAMEREGIDVIHLEVGEPRTSTRLNASRMLPVRPSLRGIHIIPTVWASLISEKLSPGIISRPINVSVSPDQIVVTSGTSPAMFLLFSALLDPGDEVILSDPCYSCYPNFIKFVEGMPVTVPVFENDGFQYRPSEISRKITKKTKAIVVNSPSNPTSNLLSEDRLRAIAELSPCVISDEVYHGLVYEGKEHSILEFTDNAFVLNGFSKLYAMTGLRLGYLIAPRPFIRPIQILQQNFLISANSVIQIAGIAALEQAGEDVARMKAIYNERRKYMVRRLKELGFGITIEPTGAFYVFANARHISQDSFKFAFDILEKAHVGVTPGIDFGKNGEGYLRFSYANSLENISEGLDRVEKYLDRLSG
jgi:(5-formylfuran-3-yl)methyl phosphate transaminase